LRARDTERAHARGEAGLRPSRRARRARPWRRLQFEGRRRAHPDDRLRRPGEHVDGDPPRRLLPARPRARTRHADQAPAGDLLACLTIVLANIITVGLCFLLLNRLAAPTAVPGHLLV